MAKNRTKCYECGVPIIKLIREYNVRASTGGDKTYYIGRFASGLPPFSKKKNAENKWTIQKEGLQNRQITDALKEKYKNKPWSLEDETGQHQYLGHLEGTQSAVYYLLMMQGKEFVAIPAGSWYNFNKIAQYKQLTLEEAEEKMKQRRSNAAGYERWMMKTASSGAAAFGENKKIEAPGPGGGASDPARPKKGKGDEDGNTSDRAEEDEEEEEVRKGRLGLRKSGEDDEDGAKGGDFDLDDDDIEKGDDWEHEEIFTDDDEAVGNDPEEREDLAPEIPAPPEIKQDDSDESEGEGGLSKSGKELKKLLGKSAGLNETESEEDDDDEDDADDDAGASPVLVPKKEILKEEPIDNSQPKATPAAATKGAPSVSKSSKSKRKPGSDDAKGTNGTPAKKVKTEKNENDAKPSPVKEEPSSAKANQPSKLAASKPPSTSTATGPVTEDEIRQVLLSRDPVNTQQLVGIFKPRLKTKEDKNAFADILKRISKIQKTNGLSYVVLRDK